MVLIKIYVEKFWLVKEDLIFMACDFSHGFKDFFSDFSRSSKSIFPSNCCFNFSHQSLQQEFFNRGLKLRFYSCLHQKFKITKFQRVPIMSFSSIFRLLYSSNYRYDFFHQHFTQKRSFPGGEFDLNNVDFGIPAYPCFGILNVRKTKKNLSRVISFSI